MRQSMQWADIKDHQYNNQISELVTLTLDDLSQIKQLWYNQYQATTSFPEYHNFGGKVATNTLKSLEWQAYLNSILRYKSRYEEQVKDFHQ